jgi:hypothetical protein
MPNNKLPPGWGEKKHPPNWVNSPNSKPNLSENSNANDIWQKQIPSESENKTENSVSQQPKKPLAIKIATKTVDGTATDIDKGLDIAEKLGNKALNFSQKLKGLSATPKPSFPKKTPKSEVAENDSEEIDEQFGVIDTEKSEEISDVTIAEKSSVVNEVISSEIPTENLAEKPTENLAENPTEILPKKITPTILQETTPPKYIPDTTRSEKSEKTVEIVKERGNKGILLISFIFLLLAIAFVIFYFFFYPNGKKTSTVSETPTSATSSTTSVSENNETSYTPKSITTPTTPTITPQTNTTPITTATTTQPITTTVPATTTPQTPSTGNGELPQSYYDAIEKYSSYSDYYYYALEDWNKDGIRELYIGTYNGPPTDGPVLIDIEQLNTPTNEYWEPGGIKVYADNIVVTYGGAGGGGAETFDTNFNVVCSLTYHYDEYVDEKFYYIGEKSVSESEYTEYISQFSREEINRSFTWRPISSFSNDAPLNAPISEDAYDFYNDTGYIWYLKVTTNGTLLNLRSEPNTGADILAKIPDGSQFWGYEIVEITDPSDENYGKGYHWFKCVWYDNHNQIEGYVYSKWVNDVYTYETPQGTNGAYTLDTFWSFFQKDTLL